ncbi:MAG: Helix-turn-helix domain [Firmicutes bacterium]|nr:Helix-turn-helix domain [Bacillota bacterium]
METAITNSPETQPHLYNEDMFLTATEVSTLFFNGKLKYSRILRMTRDGELPAMKQGKSYIYLWSALEKWADKNFNKPNWAHKARIKRM